MNAAQRHATGDVYLPDNHEELLDERQTAKLLACSIHKLRRDRWTGRGCPFVKLTERGAVRYRRQDIDTFIASRIRRSTKEMGAGDES